MEENPKAKLVGKVYSVNRSSEKNAPKKPVGYGYFKLGVGMNGDAHSNPDDPARQVSLLAHEDYALIDHSTPIGTYSENITTEGIELFTLPIGSQLKIGEQVLLQIGQINKLDQSSFDESAASVKRIVSGRIVYAYVRAEGEISEGDEIRIIKPDL